MINTEQDLKIVEATADTYGDLKVGYLTSQEMHNYLGKFNPSKMREYIERVQELENYIRAQAKQIDTEYFNRYGDETNRELLKAEEFLSQSTKTDTTED